MDDMESKSPGSWFVDVCQLVISDLPCVEMAANANMLVFQLPSVPDVREIRAALEQVHSEYRKKVEDAGRTGLFYAWVDEISGTVRCSFCEVDGFSELPFQCSLKRAMSLDEIAASVIRSYSDGVPSQELVEVGWSDPDDIVEVELLVFAEPVGAFNHRESAE